MNSNENPDWNKVQNEEEWQPVTLEEVIGASKGMSDAEVGKALEAKGYQRLSNGKWHSPDANTFVSDYVTAEPANTVQQPDAVSEGAREMQRVLERRQRIKNL